MPSPADYEDAPLAAASDLTAYGTFAEAVVLAAGQGIRRETDWHIAPVVTETVTVHSDGDTALLLPSLRVNDVTEIRDADGAVLTGWTFRANGVVHLSCGWPLGAIEVDLVHGYDACPKELLPVLARRCRDATAAGAGQVRLGSLSIGTTSVGTTVTAQDDAVIARYSL